MYWDVRDSLHDSASMLVETCIVVESFKILSLLL